MPQSELHNISVYSLSGPDGQVRYIGHAANPSVRRRQHIGKALANGPYPIHVWIR